MKKRKYFSEIIREKSTVLVPGVFNAITARLMDQLKFQAIYLSGAGVSNALLGKPDVGLIQLSELVQQVSYISAVTSLPLIVDADTGFGGPPQVEHCVRLLEAAGASAIQIEDQVSHKKCEHLEGKKLIPMKGMVSKIEAAVRGRRDKRTWIIARTDARGVGNLGEAIERSSNYAAAGADMVFPEALESRKDFAEFAKAVKIPLLANMTEFGKTPYFSIQEFRKMGYHCVIFPMTAFRLMMGSAETGLRELKRAGTQKRLLSKMQTRRELYRLINYHVS